MNKLIERQLRKAHQEGTGSSLNIDLFLSLVEQTYLENEQNQRLKDRSLKLMSEELLEFNQQTLRESRQSIASIMERVADPVITFGKNYRILSFNLVAQNLFEYTKDQITGLKFTDLVFGRDRILILRLVNQLMDPSEDVLKLTMDITGLTRSGAKLELELSLSRLQIEGRETFFVIARDISARNRYMQELVAAKISAEKAAQKVEHQKNQLEETLTKLQRMQQQLVHSEKLASIGVLSAGIAHEINNPLNYIAGGINALRDEIHDAKLDGELLERLNEAVKMVDEGYNRTAKIVKSLTSLSLKNSEMELHDLNEIVENAVFSVQERSNHAINTQMIFELDSHVPVYADHLHQVFLNLMDNAVNAASQGDTMVTPTITVRTKNARLSNNVFAEVEIHNTGKSIPTADLKRVFDPFFTTKQQGHGAGLGLSLCYSLVHQHQGTIEIDNAPQGGVAVVVRLPISVDIHLKYD